jgi:sulfite exporter TauE/SafE
LSAQLADLFTAEISMIPLVALSIGLLGSAHCVGMCGPLAAFAHSKSRSLWPYQWGRLFSYLLLGAFGSFLGSLFTIQVANPYFSLVPAILMALFFVYWGLILRKGMAMHLPLPKFISRLYQRFSKKHAFKSDGTGSFFLGLFSIFLPCGLLYGVVLTMATFQQIWIGVVALFFFWLGTMPAMGLAPAAFQKVLNPFFKKYPKFSGHFMISVGVLTLGIRVYTFVQSGGQACH